MSSLLSNVNITVLVPVCIVFALMRIKAVYNVALRLISGLRFFTERKFAAIIKAPTNNPSPSDVIEQSIAKLNLTMIELDDSVATKYVLQKQLFYDLFEAMVNLALGCVLAYVWSMCYHCAVPSATSSSWVVLLMLALAIFSFQCLLQILMMTGWRAKETKLAIIVGFVTFLVSMAQFLSGLSYIDSETVTDIAIHVNALLIQISPSITAINLMLLTPIVQIALSVVCGLMVAGLVIPSLRYSQAIETLNYGMRAELSSNEEKNLLWVDFILPMMVGIVFSPLPRIIEHFHYPSGMPCPTAADGSPGTCSKQDMSQLDFFDNLFVALQLAFVGAMMLTRLLCMKKHLQCFLDSVVRVVSAHLMAVGAGQKLDQTALLPTVKACTDYLMAAATQYLAVPLFIIACVMLMHKSSPVGTGMCYSVYELVGADKAPLLTSISSAIQFNSSAIAVESAAKPYFVSILQAAAGAQMTGGNLSGATPSSLLTSFALKMSEVYALPSRAAVTLCKALVCMHSLSWFVLNLTGVLAWRYKPGMIVSGQTVNTEAPASPPATAADAHAK
mmetsp:Transcript_3176/g.6616  ORF Transcript_3176/g.6616 Transcript_3176/m.6616 type:complete len:559 (+) Transcript_3176:67-1743(+)